MQPEVGRDAALWLEALAWLEQEAELLDEGRFGEWLALVTEDISYTMPVRVTRERGSGADVDHGNQHYLENLETLTLRVRRLETDFAWAEDPPSRTRRFVTNVRPRAADGGIDVKSYLLVYRNRGDVASVEWFSAERRDHLCRTRTGLRLNRREILIDQATLGARNVSLIL